MRHLIHKYRTRFHDERLKHANFNEQEQSVPTGERVAVIFPARISGSRHNDEEEFLRGSRFRVLSTSEFSLWPGWWATITVIYLMSTATYQPREKEERVAMAIGLSTIERVKSKARIVFERTRPGESVSKNNGVFNPYPYARSFRSSFPLFSPRILVRTLRSWWKRDLVWFCCSYLLYRPCFSSLKGALWKSAGVVSSIFRCFVNNEFLLLFLPCFLFFSPFYRFIYASIMTRLHFRRRDSNIK